MNQRIKIAFLFTIIACGIVCIAYTKQTDSFTSGLLVNIGTGLVEIVVTLTVVDILLERGRCRDEARKMAWNTLHDLDHVVWVWQGGQRELDVLELAGLLRNVEDTDPLEDCTAELLVSLGVRASNTCRLRDDIMNIAPHLEEAYRHLKPLASLRDGTTIRNSEIANFLRSALSSLDRTLKFFTLGELATARASHHSRPLTRDPSSRAQLKRRFGYLQTDRQSNP